MLETSTRLLRLLSLLQLPRGWTGVELSERLEVSRRTVRADIERLRRLGYPVVAARGATGGYRLGAGGQIPPLLLDDEEAVAVAIGLRTGVNCIIGGMEETSLRALTKLEQVLPAGLRARVNNLSRYTVPMDIDRPGPLVDPAMLTMLANLCRDRERVRLVYALAGGHSVDLDVEPYRLANSGHRWYLIAYDVDLDGWTCLRIDALLPRTPTGPRFSARPLPDADIATLVSGHATGAMWRYQADVTVHAPADVVLARIPPAMGSVEAMDERSCRLHTGAETVEGLALQLGKLGADFTVTRPAELITELRELAERYRKAIT